MELTRESKEIDRLVQECLLLNGDGDTVNVRKIAEAYGIKILNNSKIKDEHPDFALSAGENARLFYDGKNGIVILDDALPIEQKRLSVAHELGHYVLRHWEELQAFNNMVKELERLKTLNAEREADIFAEKLLSSR